MERSSSSQSPSIPEFVHTPADSIPGICKKIRLTFLSLKTRPVQWRLSQLRKLYWALKDNAPAIYEACKKDLGQGETETYLTELGWCMNDIVFMSNNLEKWVKDEGAPDIPLVNKLFFPKIRKDPMGAVLIIGPYNLPINLSFGPLIGAIAAGCTAIVKPSESAPSAAAVMQKIVAEALDPDAFIVVQGAVPEATALLDEKWDKIFYTGGAAVAKIISKKAAETLTPVTLELGGKNPAIVTKNADIKLAARRLLWAKSVNAGQICVSQNYIIVDEAVLPTLITELEKSLKDFYPKGMKASPDFGRIATRRAFDKLQTMLSESKGKILLDSDESPDAESLFFPITVVQVSSPEDSLIAEESFGPLMTLLPVPDLDTAIRIANEVSATPLGMYPFGSKAETDRILNEVRSGGATVNDAFFHATLPTLQFGGVGESGQGSYRGKSSFDCFTHRRSVVTTPGWMESMLSMRYPPFQGTNKLKKYQNMTDLKPNFDRDGKNTGWLGWL